MVLAIGGYSRIEPAHWDYAASPISDHDQALLAGGYHFVAHGREIYLEEGDSDTVGDHWIRTVKGVLGSDFVSDWRPWQQGWPPEMITGRYTSIVEIQMPFYVPTLITALIVIAWLVQKLR